MSELNLRLDQLTIADWIRPGSRVLDLGCGDGDLLAYLIRNKGVSGYGLEIDENHIVQCVKKGVNVIEQDLDEGLDNFETNSFDVLIMTQALQAVVYPDKVLDEMLRVGRSSIITFPNFGHWRCRTYLSFKGKMPVSKMLPYTWYNTPNIHLCTFRDFEKLCRDKHIRILEKSSVDQQYRDSFTMRVLPNLFGEIALYHVAK